MDIIFILEVDFLGRRRRKKVIKIYKPKIPKVFVCPICGNTSLDIRIDRKKGVGYAKCAICGLEWETNVKPYEEKIDIYHRLFDEVIETHGGG